MPRPRKYDYTKDYPVTIFVKIPVELYNKLQEIGYSNNDIQKEIEESKVLINLINKIIRKEEK